jgi:hypothetical protein
MKSLGVSQGRKHLAHACAVMPVSVQIDDQQLLTRDQLPSLGNVSFRLGGAGAPIMPS